MRQVASFSIHKIGNSVVCWSCAFAAAENVFGLCLLCDIDQLHLTWPNCTISGKQNWQRSKDLFLRTAIWIPNGLELTHY